jgi:hypothetical protein
MGIRISPPGLRLDHSRRMAYYEQPPQSVNKVLMSQNLLDLADHVCSGLSTVNLGWKILNSHGDQELI